MKRILSAFFIFITVGVSAQNDKYKFYLDLNKINSDLIQVELIPPVIKSEKIVYNIPKIVPGTYNIYDFGQYVMDFEAFDTSGAMLTVNRLDENRWEIDGANKLGKLTYWVEDTWDADVDKLVFEPGGTTLKKMKMLF